MLFVYLFTVIGATLSGVLLRNFGNRTSTLFGALWFGFSLPLIPLSPTLPILCASMSSFGFGLGVMDVSMNSCGVLTEVVAQKPLMGSFHGSYSIAAAGGSLLGAALTNTNMSPTVVFSVVAGCTAVLSAVSFFAMYSFSQEKVFVYKNENREADVTAALNGKESVYSSIHERQESEPSNSPRILSITSSPSTSSLISTSTWSQWLPIGPTLILCLIGFFASFGEGSVVTWAIVYMQREITSDAELQSLGFTSFMICMGLGRFSVDFLRGWYGRQLIVKVSGLLAMAGLGLLVLAPSLPEDSPLCLAVACIGLGISGCGLSTLIPTMFSSAGHLPGVHAGTAISTVAAFTYSGSIVSAPFLGGISDLFGSLRYAMAVNALILGTIFPLGFFIPPEDAVFVSNKPAYQPVGNALFE